MGSEWFGSWHVLQTPEKYNGTREIINVITSSKMVIVVRLCYYCINTGAARYYLPCINEEKSRVLIMEFACARAVVARLLIMFVARHHVKHVLNYEYLTAARILHSGLA